jgi:hypothetical protein
MANVSANREGAAPEWDDDLLILLFVLIQVFLILLHVTVTTESYLVDAVEFGAVGCLGGFGVW